MNAPYPAERDSDGRLASYVHTPVLLQEIVALLDPQPGFRILDGTVGTGGHAEALLSHTEGKAELIGFDRDETALAIARERLAKFGEHVRLFKENFADASVASTISRSLGLIGDPTATPALKPLLNHPDKKVNLAAGLALSRLGDKSGVPAARQFVKDPDSYLRRMSVEILSEQGGAQDVETLKKLKSDPDKTIRDLAAMAVENLTRKTAPQAAKPAAIQKPSARGARKKSP